MQAAPATGQPPSTGIFVAPLERVEGGLRLGAAEPIAAEPGYDNQPFFTADASGHEALLFTSQRAGEQTEIYRWEFTNARLVRLTDTEESEYSPTPLPEGGGFSVVRVEADGRQRLWRFDADGSNPRLLIEKLAPVGYHAWAGAGEAVAIDHLRPGFRRRLRQHPPPGGPGERSHRRAGDDPRPPHRPGLASDSDARELELRRAAREPAATGSSAAGVAAGTDRRNTLGVRTLDFGRCGDPARSRLQ